MVNHRMSVALHILSLIAITEHKEQLTSDWIANSVNTNPVVIRRLMSSLNKAGLIRAGRGLKGMTLTRDPSEITLLDVYKAVAPNHELFAIHQDRNMDCTVGCNIEHSLNNMYGELQGKLELEMKQKTLAMLLAGVQKAGL